MVVKKIRTKKRRTFRQNNTAVSVPLEFTIAFSIMLIGLSFLLISASQMFSQYDTSDADVMGKTATLADVLINNPGHPVNWQDDLNALERLGLARNHPAYKEDSYGILDLDKINALSSLTYDDGDPDALSDFKSSLGLDKSFYDYHIEIIEINDPKNPKTLCDYGPEVSGTIRKNFERNVLIDTGSNKDKGRIIVTIFG